MVEPHALRNPFTQTETPTATRTPIVRMEVGVLLEHAIAETGAPVKPSGGLGKAAPSVIPDGSPFLRIIQQGGARLLERVGHNVIPDAGPCGKRAEQAKQAQQAEQQERHREREIQQHII